MVEEGINRKEISVMEEDSVNFANLSCIPINL